MPLGLSFVVDKSWCLGIFIIASFFLGASLIAAGVYFVPDQKLLFGHFLSLLFTEPVVQKRIHNVITPTVVAIRRPFASCWLCRQWLRGKKFQYHNP